MARKRWILGSVTVASAIAVGFAAHGRSLAKRVRPRQPVRVDFAMLGPGLGVGTPPSVARSQRSLAGSAIAALHDGVLVVDGDSGALVRTTAAGEVLATMALAKDASQVAVDRPAARAYVANRHADEIAVVDVSGTSLRKVASFATDAEPFGVALTPRGDTLLVTTVADRTLAAFDTRTGERHWSINIGPEARGVAVAPSGTRALVTFLNNGIVADIDLAGDEPRVAFRSLNPTDTAVASPVGLRSKHFGGQPATGRKFARNAFAAMFVGNDLAIVPHQLSRPDTGNGAREVRSTYGGGDAFDPPIAHRLAFVGGDRIAIATIDAHQPRAAAYDAASDTLYVAGFGSDNVLAIGDVSQASVHLDWKHTVKVPDGASADACAPTGLAVDDDGDVLAYCSLQRSVVKLSAPTQTPAPALARLGGELATSRYSAAQRRGAAMFRAGNDPAMSTFGAMACASCHPEGRADGLSWRIEGKALQTPLLLGRVASTHPYKWDGGDADIQTSLLHTVRRLGGSGISVAQAKDLRAFLEVLEPPRAPTVRDANAVARGKRIFDSERAGCATCHSGEQLTNRTSYDLADDLPKVDTPSLVGLAASAPYYHDGSASTLRALLMENGTVHGMGKVAHLSSRQVDDLIAYLLTL